MKYKSVAQHLDFCTTDHQRTVIQMSVDGMTQTEIAKELGKDRKRIHELISNVHNKAALQGVAPEYSVNRQTAPGFTTKRISTAYNTDNEIVLQWHIQEPERQKLEELIAQFVEGFKDEVTGLHAPKDPPKGIDDDYMVSYIIGDHHLGMLAHHSETMGEDYDVKISQRLLESAIDRLVSVAPAGKVFLLRKITEF